MAQVCVAIKQVFLLKYCHNDYGGTLGVTAWQSVNSSVNCGQDYATALDLLQELILSTDVAEHVKVIKEIEQMVEGLFTFIAWCVLNTGIDRISIKSAT